MATRITAEICRQEAKAVAAEVQATTDTAYKAALATVGSFWVDLGNLSLALGDPDELVEVQAKRREKQDGDKSWKMP
jgi:hypothetical protein